MKNEKNSLNDSDRLIVAVALWLALVPLFATSLTLPMLPKSIQNAVVAFDPQVYSKYGNLLIVFASVAPVAVVLIAAMLKKRSRIQRRFVSMIIFCVMLSVCMSGLAIFGINRQFVSLPKEKPLDLYTLFAVILSLLLSVACTLIPRIFHTEKFLSRSTSRSPMSAELANILDRFWNIGAYGYMIVGAVASFISSPLAFIPPAAATLLYIALLLIFASNKSKHKAEAVPEEQQTVSEQE
ncbi:MAG: hypothetical protein J1F39_05820 [Clostridiales bacterium]|nr:hypothetical protein [Clostridiales bacterium]